MQWWRLEWSTGPSFLDPRWVLKAPASPLGSIVSSLFRIGKVFIVGLDTLVRG